MLLFDEGLQKNIVLPNKPVGQDDNESTFQGAIRDTEANGLYFNIGKADLTSAYPSMIINFCLDTPNIVDKAGPDTMEINGVHFKQNAGTLLPSVVKRILVAKDKLKKLKKENAFDRHITIKYDAIKAIANSTFGVFGNQYFRLYNQTIASSITFLVRDLLLYVKDRLNKEGISVIYYDTDSVFYNKSEDITPKLNQFIKDWAKERFNKDSIDLKFEYEGYFESLFILGRCHYYGYIAGNAKPEIKGLEVKRSSSSKYEAFFQETLLNKVLKKEPREKILDWVTSEQERMKTLPLEEVGFPCKLSAKEYKNYPIFMRAYDNTRKINKSFKVNKGELFYYLFTNDSNEVLAFTDDNKDFVKKDTIAWNKIVDRNIFGKAEKIFEALKWYLPKNSNQLTLF
jgi:DNA polymerase elongation subunit (family B)